MILILSIFGFMLSNSNLLICLIFLEIIIVVSLLWVVLVTNRLIIILIVFVLIVLEGVLALNGLVLIILSRGSTFLSVKNLT
jgi:hypothetical protein